MIVVLLGCVGLTAGVAASGAASAATAGPAHPASAGRAAQPVADELEGIWCASIKGCIAVGGDRN